MRKRIWIQTQSLLSTLSLHENLEVGRHSEWPLRECDQSGAEPVSPAAQDPLALDESSSKAVNAYSQNYMKYKMLHEGTCLKC